MPAPCPTDCFEFYFARSDTLVRVENTPGEVIVRMSRDTFSEARKSAFIRELASEGFIPDEYLWLAPRGVRWLRDITWLRPAPPPAAGRRLAVFFLITFALWGVILGGAVLRNLG